MEQTSQYKTNNADLLEIRLIGCDSAIANQAEDIINALASANYRCTKRSKLYPCKQQIERSRVYLEFVK